MLTVVEISAYLGVTAGYVRKLVAQKDIKPTGRRGRAYLYDIDTVLRHTGTRDRACVSV